MNASPPRTSIRGVFLRRSRIAGAADRTKTAKLFSFDKCPGLTKILTWETPIMSKWISSTALILALLTLAIFSGRSVKADDSSTTQPSTTKGSITVTVLDSSSNPVVKANVKLYAKQKPADSDADNGAPAKPKAIGSGKT